MQNNNSEAYLSTIQQGKRKKRIMAVDDEEDVTFCLSTVLQETGLFEVDSFTDPEEALSNFKPNFYDLVILDIKMPNMDGFEIYEKIKTKDEKVSVCFLTAVTDFSNYKKIHPDIIDEIEKSDDSCIIDKPSDTEQFIKKINKIMRTRS